MPKHRNGATCESCADKLKSAHPHLVKFFWRVRLSFPDCHVAYAFRGKKEQDDAYASGKSALKWPNSKHNVTPSRAIDLFFQDDQGKGSWPTERFKEIHVRCGAGLRWGGDFSHLHDYCHWEMPSSA